MKHFIHLNDFSKQEIFQIFELADKLKADNGECDWLKGKAIVFFFPESSIRTISFFNPHISNKQFRVSSCKK